MNHRSDSAPHPRTDKQARTSTPTARRADRGRRLLGELARGSVLGGIAYLLGSCSLLLGTAPLGIALLAASSAYTWYILIGLVLAAVFHPVTLSPFAWVGVYIFCIVLRLCIRLFVDPPILPDGGVCGGWAYLRLAWRSLTRSLGIRTEEDDPTRRDYYQGAPFGPSPDPNEVSGGEGTSSPSLFAEHPFLRMLTAAVAGFAAGLFGMLTGHFHVYDLLGTLFLLVATPLVTCLLVSCFGEAGLALLFSPTPLRDIPVRPGAVRGKALSNRDGGMGQLMAHVHPLSLLAVSGLIVATVFAARTFDLSFGSPYLSVSLSTLLGLVLTLSASARLGVLPGVAVGIISGLSADPRLSPLFILCAGGYALLHCLSHRTGVVGGCAVGALWCAVVEGLPTLTHHLPAILLCVPIYLMGEKLWEALPLTDGHVHTDRELEDFTATVTAALSAETCAEAQRARLKALSEAFSALSRRFYTISGQLKKPRLPELRRLCDEAFGRTCARCPHRERCWSDEYDRTLELQSHLSDALHIHGRANLEGLPAHFVESCPHLEAIIEDINTRYARMTEALRQNEKTEVIAADYAAMAALLRDALEEDRQEASFMEENRVAADRIYDYLCSEGVTVQGVVVAGKPEGGRRRVIVSGIGLEALADEPRITEIRTRFEEICGSHLGLPIFEADGNGQASTVMTLHAEAELDTVYAGSTVPAEADRKAPLPPPLTADTPEGVYEPPTVCGDHIALFKTDNAYFYALISDGMGSGEDASLTSDICTTFLCRMLSAGNRVEVSLRMLDSYLRSKNTGTGNECSATVDLMELDLMDGRAIFAKSGAAPTYVVRDGTVYKLRSRSMPLGILRDTPPELLRFRMHPGDVVVMVSDGVTQGYDECPWLIDLLSTPLPESMDTLRHDIIKRALSAGSEDDLSAIAIRVEKVEDAPRKNTEN